MKQRMIAILLALALLLCCACQKTPAQAASGPAEPAPSKSLPSASAASAAAEPSPAAAEIDWQGTQQDLLDWLAGDWVMLPGGDVLSQQPTIWLTVDPAQQRMVFADTESSEHVGASFTIDPLFTEMPANDLLCLKFDEATEGALSGYSNAEILNTRVDLQVIPGIANGREMIALREIGNGDSMFAYGILDYDRQANDTCWIFERMIGAQPETFTDAENEALRKKNESFFAWRWFDSGDFCCLQPLESLEYEEEWYDGEMLPAVCYALPKGKTALKAPLYPVAEALKDPDAPPALRIVLPGLVRVTTDSTGTITAMEGLPYLIYGLYSPHEMNGAPDVDRDPAIFGETDRRLLGTWYEADGADEFLISPADPQTGGYELTLFSGGEDILHAFANLEDGGLRINQGTVDNRFGLTGKVEETDDGVRLVVTDSPSDRLAAGTYDFFPLNGGPQIMNGAGPDERDPKLYDATDAIYLGAWESESPRALLEIKPAPPPAGGYELVLSISGNEMAQAYAHAVDGTLVVNQGTIMNSYDFGGTVEKTADGIRFTVTESAFGPIRPGTSWDLVGVAAG